MKTRPFWKIIFSAALLIAIGLFFILYFPELTSKTHRGKSEKIKIARVIDGDTVVLDNGERVRYIGIDAPEMNFEKEGSAECFSDEALVRNKELVEGKVVRLESDLTNRDKYNRLLRYVYLEADDKEVFVNKVLVEGGYAKTMAISPNLKYFGELKKAQEEAIRNQRGLWAPGVCK